MVIQGLHKHDIVTPGYINMQVLDKSFMDSEHICDHRLSSDA